MTLLRGLLILLCVVCFWGFGDGPTVEPDRLAAEGANIRRTNYYPVQGVRAVDDDECWTVDTGKSRTRNAPVVCGDSVYLANATGILSAHTIRTGAELWTFKAATVLSSPFVCNDLVYSIDSKGTLYVLDAATGEVQWQRLVQGYERPLKQESTEAGGMQITLVASKSSPPPPVVDNNTIYLATDYGKILALENKKDGELKWTFESGSNINGAYPSIADGIIYFGTDGGHIIALRCTTGEKVWDFDAGSQVWTMPVVEDGLVFTLAHNHFYALDAKSGLEQWRAEKIAGHASPALGNGVVYVVHHGGTIEAFHMKTGKLKWRKKIKQDFIYVSLTLTNDMLYLGGNMTGCLYGYDCETGNLLWEKEVGAIRYGAMAASEKRVFVYTNSGQIVSVAGKND